MKHIALALAITCLSACSVGVTRDGSKQVSVDAVQAYQLYQMIKAERERRALAAKQPVDVLP